MGRGLISGLIWGALVMVMAVALLSLSSPLPERPEPVAGSMAEPEPEAAPETGPLVDPQAPAPEVDPAPAPQTGPAPEPATDPAAQDGPSATPETDPAPATSGPASEIPLPAGSNFNRPPEEREATLPGIDTAPAAAPSVLSDLTAPSAPPVPNTAPAPQPVATATLQPPSETALTESAGPTPTPGDGPQPVATGDQPAPLGLPTIEADPEAETAAAAPPAPVETPTQTPEETPAGTSTEPPAPQGSPLQRLTTGGTSPVANPVLVPDTLAEPAADLPAIEAFAAPFDAEETRPLMAVILIDDPSFPLGRSALTRFDFPVSFAIDPTRPDAAEAAADYRAAGFEVVMLADGFTDVTEAAQVAPAMQAGLAALPEAVALLDTPASAIQANRVVLEGVVGMLAETGHGLVAYPRGLNVAEQTASRIDVPAATLFRQIDEDRERATVITRYLDRAAFAAGQEGQVIVVGHTYSDTVTALFSWALGSRSEGVALAPLSAVLTR